MRLADILRQIKGEEADKLVETLREAQVEETESVQQEVYETYEGLQKSAKELYGEIITSVRKMLQAIEAGITFNVSDFIGIIAKTKLSLKNDQFGLIYYTEKSTPDVYLVGHTANVFILSTYLAMSLNYSDKTVNEISLAALLHDLGMIKYLGIVSVKAKLKAEEIKIIREHVKETVSIINSNITGLPGDTKSKIIEIVSQIHEREDGSGYPDGVKNMLNEAKIISVVDIYEALSHYRPWRGRHLMHDAIKMIIEMSQKGELNKNVVKCLVERLSFYPVGSFVKLNTGEIGRVVRPNFEMPLRPVVEILLDVENKKIHNKVVDLAKNPNYMIVEAVDESKLQLKDKKLALELKTQHWWIK